MEFEYSRHCLFPSNFILIRIEMHYPRGLGHHDLPAQLYPAFSERSSALALKL
jgi:hypothetical protein